MFLQKETLHWRKRERKKERERVRERAPVLLEKYQKTHTPSVHPFSC